MKLPLLSGRQVLAALQRLGFVRMDGKGSHVKMKHRRWPNHCLPLSRRSGSLHAEGRASRCGCAGRRFSREGQITCLTNDRRRHLHLRIQHCKVVCHPKRSIAWNFSQGSVTEYSRPTTPAPAAVNGYSTGVSNWPMVRVFSEIDLSCRSRVDRKPFSCGARSRPSRKLFRTPSARIAVEFFRQVLKLIRS